MIGGGNYTLTDVDVQEERSVASFFDFGLRVQTIGPKDEPEKESDF